jgi:nicotinamidase-related amidase
MELNNPALIIVDVQKIFKNVAFAERNNLDAESNIVELLSIWRKRNLPIIHIQYLSNNEDSVFHPSNSLSEFQDEVVPMDGEVVFQKSVNSAFIGTKLEGYLKSNGLTDVVIVGLTTPHCVSTTTRMSGNLGFKTYLITDATAAFGLTGPDNKYYSADEIHNISIASLHNEFATCLTTKQLFLMINS